MLLWMDGFDTYGVNGGDIASILGTSLYAGASGTFDSNTRTGRGLCVKLQWASVLNPREVSKAIPMRDELIVGFAFKYVEMPTISTMLVLGYDNLMGSVTTQLSLKFTATGTITVQAAGETQAYSDPNTVFPSVWHYIEVRVKAGSGGAGSITVRVDGATVINANIQTVSAASPAPGYNLVRWMSYQLEGANFHDRWVDDIYICDTRENQFNTFQGDVVIHGVTVAQDVGPNEMNMFGGLLQHYSAVNEIPPDGDVSYLYSNTAGHKEMFQIGELPANIIDVYAVSVHARVKKDAPGASGMKFLNRVGADTQEGGVTTLTTNYTTRGHVFMNAPDGSAWSRNKAVDCHIGVELT